MQKITTFLWFDKQAEEAAKLYVSLFKNSQINSVHRYENAGPQQNETVTLVEFTLEGQKFSALDGGPLFKFNESISLLVNCETQEEVDRLWAKLTEGGHESQCGWLKDKYGLSWQIIPTALNRLMSDPDREKGGRVMKAMLQMQKIDIAALQKAYDGK